MGKVFLQFLLLGGVMAGILYMTDENRSSPANETTVNSDTSDTQVPKVKVARHRHQGPR